MVGSELSENVVVGYLHYYRMSGTLCGVIVGLTTGARFVPSWCCFDSLSIGPSLSRYKTSSRLAKLCLRERCCFL